ncbi:MAG: right-handed parallel beta-helix repeat-containing protein [Verrucomicrobiales bacterium]|nr:right-handed parallel beta-helix repeat-containing protein [Verrucomicrobiales bacterium]
MLLRHLRGFLLLAWVFGLRPLTGVAAEPCGPVRTFADGRQPLREVFVSPDGNNATGNGTRSAPYKDLARALKGVSPGDAIRLLPGIHGAGNSVGSIAGTSNAPIWIGGVPGEVRPEIHGGTAALLLSRVRYLVVENLVVAGATQNGVNCDDGSDYANPDATRHLLFRNLEIRDIGTGGNHDGLKLSGVNDYQVLDCTFTRMSPGGSGIDHVGCHRGLIARCVFTDMGGNAIQCKGGSEDIEIRANRFLNGGGRAINIGGSTGFPFFRPPLSTVEPNMEARNIRVFANLFRGSDAPLAFVGAVDCVAAQNTIVEPRRWVIRILQETVTGAGYAFRPCGNNRFLNNLVVVRRDQIGTHVNVGGNTDAASFHFERNLWYASDRPMRSRPDLPSAESGGIYGLDPQFRDPPAGDFSVRIASPAVGKGLSLPVPRADLLERCYAEVPTLGAFEAVP